MQFKFKFFSFFYKGNKITSIGAESIGIVLKINKTLLLINLQCKYLHKKN